MSKTIKRMKSTFRTAKILRIHEDSSTVHVVCEDVETKERCRMYGNAFSLAILGDTFRVVNIAYAGDYQVQIKDTSWCLKTGYVYLEETLENPFEYYKALVNH